MHGDKMKRGWKMEDVIKVNDVTLPCRLFGA